MAVELEPSSTFTWPKVGRSSFEWFPLQFHFAQTPKPNYGSGFSIWRASKLSMACQGLSSWFQTSWRRPSPSTERNFPILKMTDPFSSIWWRSWWFFTKIWSENTTRRMQAYRCLKVRGAQVDSEKREREREREGYIYLS